MQRNSNSYLHKTQRLSSEWGYRWSVSPNSVSPVLIWLLPSSSSCSGWVSPPDRALFPELTLLNAWDRQRQQNKEKVWEPKWGRDRERELPVWVKRWSYTAIFRSGMLLYETGKWPPSVYGWGLSDRGDYLYFTTRTHATVRAQGKARKGGLFKTKHSPTKTDVIQWHLN